LYVSKKRFQKRLLRFVRRRRRRRRREEEEGEEGENSSLRKHQKSIQKSVLGTRVIEVCQKKEKEKEKRRRRKGSFIRKSAALLTALASRRWPLHLPPHDENGERPSPSSP
jgi:hypothetical protein